MTSSNPSVDDKIYTVYVLACIAIVGLFWYYAKQQQKTVDDFLAQYKIKLDSSFAIPVEKVEDE